MPKRPPFFIALTLLSVVLSGLALMHARPLDWRFAIDEPSYAAVSDADLAPRFETVFDLQLSTGQAHSPAVAVTDDQLSLIWFQGTREGAEDVQIMRTVLARDESGWQESAPEPLLSVAPVSQGLVHPQRVRKLGNTIQFAPGVADRFLATVVAVGGWAMAGIADVTVDAAGGGDTRARLLPLSPMLNRSHLVRAPARYFEGGDIALPAYYEMGFAFGQLVRLSPEGRVRDRVRIGQGRHALQPVIVPLSATHAVTLLRNFDGRGMLYRSETRDGGQNWSPLAQAGDLLNPNAPVAAIALGDGRILMAFNDSSTRADLLRLAVSEDGGESWRRIATLEDHGGDRQMQARYPMFARTDQGEILLVYSTGSKRGIRAHVFNQAWVDAQ